jgi:hypothetical protein
MKIISETETKVIQGKGSSLAVIKKANCAAMGLNNSKGQKLRQILGFDKEGFYTTFRPVNKG